MKRIANNFVLAISKVDPRMVKLATAVLTLGIVIIMRIPVGDGGIGG